MKKSRLLGVLSAYLFTFIPTISSAALFTQASGDIVYDQERNVSWLANANLAITNQVGVSGITDGKMSWDTANLWIAAMNNYDSGTGWLGFTDWRLPNTTVPDGTCADPVDALGFNCTGSELGHLFYEELGGTANQSITTSTDPDLALFSNIGTDAHYWSSTPYIVLNDHHYAFPFGRGDQGALLSGPDYVWAVRLGTSAVPLPAALWLFGSGLLGLIGIARRKKAAQEQQE